METLKQLKKLRLSSMMFLLLMAFGCSTENTDPVIPSEDISPEATEDATAMISHLRQVNQDGPIYLSGVQRYYTYAVKMKEVLQGGDGDPGVNCVAELKFLDGQNMQLALTEWPGEPWERTSNFIGKMTPSGQVKFTFVEPGIIDVIEMHSGCEVYGGPGVNQNNLVYKGSFDGERLVATAPFYTKCEVFPYPEPTPVEGPVHWKWTIDLTVD